MTKDDNISTRAPESLRREVQEFAAECGISEARMIRIFLRFAVARKNEIKKHLTESFALSEVADQ
jgi:antitoxin component of RelBE/YafQ-DinJ toxin-antitoxin module